MEISFLAAGTTNDYLKDMKLGIIWTSEKKLRTTAITAKIAVLVVSASVVGGSDGDAA